MFSREVFEMSRNLVETFADDVRRDDRLIAAFAQSLADEVLDDAADDRALGMPEDETAAGLFLDREEIELGAELAMVAPLRFFERAEIRLEFRAVVPRRAVDALQHRRCARRRASTRRRRSSA